MFSDVWRWSCDFRNTNKNLRIDKWEIGMELKKLIDDSAYWIKNNIYLPDEIAIRFKHRIVCIHCFPNGNGRHSRLMADIIINKIFKKTVFTWGALNPSAETRTNYIKSLKLSDAGNFNYLLKFPRT
ncbi:hypothetical protein BH10BAC5_BH10BAC5_18750 [soil metagenome]